MCTVHTERINLFNYLKIIGPLSHFLQIYFILLTFCVICGYWHGRRIVLVTSCRRLRNGECRLLWRPRECFERHFASYEVTVSKVLHLQFIFLIYFLLLLIHITFPIVLGWALQIFGIHLKLFERATVWLLDCASAVYVRPDCLVKVLTAYVRSDALRLVCPL